jgi:hypothetical protein
LRDGRITDLSVKVKAHLEDPETHSTLANNLALLWLETPCHTHSSCPFIDSCKRMVVAKSDVGDSFE